MSSLKTCRTELALLTLFLGKAEARDKICRSIQFGARYKADGKPCTAQDVEKATSLARKVFRLGKFLNDVQALLQPPEKNEPWPLVILMKIKSGLLGSFLFLDQFVWAGRVGLLKDKERTDVLAKTMLMCWMGSNVCVIINEICQYLRAPAKENASREEKAAAAKKARWHAFAVIKAGLDILVAGSLVQFPWAPSPGNSGAIGVITSFMTLYQLYPEHPKPKLEEKKA